MLGLEKNKILKSIIFNPVKKPKKEIKKKKQKQAQ